MIINQKMFSRTGFPAFLLFQFCKRLLTSRIVLSFLAVHFLLLNTIIANAEDFKDFAELDLDYLLNTEVTTASKRPQKLCETSNAVYVITETDIKRSGAVVVPDLFRMVPGFDVVDIHGGTSGVSARGFNERFAQRMLFMIDGRSIYSPMFGGVFWEVTNVFLEDIKQIEIIRGPGATIWGANSACGVVNIITKDPDEDTGAVLTVKSGTKKYYENIFQFSESVSDKFSFSVTGGYKQDQGTRAVHDFNRMPKLSGKIKYKFTEDSILQVFAGYSEAEIGSDKTMYTAQSDIKVRTNYEVIRWEYNISQSSQFHIQAYRRAYSGYSKDKSLSIEEDKYDVEIHHSFKLGTKNHITWGLNYRNFRVKSNLLSPETDHDDLVGIFVQEEIELLENIKLVTGIKYEKNSFTGGDYSPRASLLYSPLPNHHFRFSVSRAYRTPSQSEISLNYGVIKVPSLPITFGSVKGNDDLEPEQMTAFEIGYRTILFNKAFLNIEMYYNEMDDFSELKLLRKTLPIVITWENEFNVIAKGIEISSDIPLAYWWTLKVNYTFQEIEVKRVNEDLIGTPKHKFNINSSFHFKNGFSLNVSAHYVDDTKWHQLFESVKVDDYVRVDMRISQKLFNDRLELSLVGQNLLDKLHPETNNGYETYEIERLIYGQLTIRFK